MKTLRRTLALILVSVTVGLSSAVAGQGGKVYRVGVILTTSPVSEMIGSHPAHGGIDIFLRELKARGYFEGQNLIVERRSAEGKSERYREIVADLIRLKANVIVTVGNAMTQRAKEVTSTVPIVMNFSIDPVGAGIVQSLAHPGGNITGLSVEAGAELEAKRLTLLIEAAPRVSKVAFLGLKDDWESLEGKSVRAAAERLRRNMFLAEAKPNEFASAFAAIERGHADAVFVSPSPPHWVHRKTIVEFTARRRLPRHIFTANRSKWVG